jgi:hypothetical protein
MPNETCAYYPQLSSREGLLKVTKVVHPIKAVRLNLNIRAAGHLSIRAAGHLSIKAGHPLKRSTLINEYRSSSVANLCSSESIILAHSMHFEAANRMFRT